MLTSSLRVCILVGLLGQPLLADDTKSSAIEDRLLKLEQEMENLRKENKQLRAELGESKGVIVKSSGREASLKLGGFVQAQADFGDKGDSRWGSRNDRFYLRRARLNVTGTFLENFDFKLETDFTGTLGESTGLRAQLTDGYVTWNHYEAASIRVGQFKTPFGFEQLYSDTKLLTMERSLPNDRMTLGRQLGAMVMGEFLDKRLSYASGAFNGNGVNTTLNDNDNFLLVERLAGVPWQGKLFSQDSKWSVGANAYYSDDSAVSGLNDFGFDSTPATAATDGTFSGHRWGAALDSQFNVGPFDLWVEYMRTRFEPKNKTPFTEVDSQGYYAQAGYYFLPKKLQGVVKYESFDPNADVSGDKTDLWTLGLNYYIKGDDLKLQFNYLLFDSDRTSENQSKFLFRLQAMF